MLTKELLNFRCSGKNIIPSFLSANSPDILALAQSLLLLYTSSTGKRRKELEEEAEREIAYFRDLKSARGFLKLLEDLCEYSLDAPVDHSLLREKLFSFNAAFFKEGALPPSPEEFRERLFRTPASFLEKFPCSEVYGDLPQNERLLGGKFPKDAFSLIHFYNLQLVRSLLLYTGRLVLTLPGETPLGALRLLFRDLLFYRLLASARKEIKRGKETGKIQFLIEGPGAILENAQKYALALASFFPAVCRLKEWEMEAVIKLDGKERKLKLDSASPLKVPPGRGGGYVPEEIRLFMEYFKERSAIELLPPEERGIRTLPGTGELIFPDMTFRLPESGITYDLELFHPWHTGKIRERLAAVEKGFLPGLLLGIDRKCLKNDPLLEEMIKENSFCFLFSNFPGVEKVEKFLLELPGKEVEKAKKNRKKTVKNLPFSPSENGSGK